ncbi:hypothetical protein [Nonomuraea jiangxiensis]|uniref:Uncharacterized protein n=1 Tax=Nonomuraea jiangxiensis TaxID=633440 RepID=A0A1G9JKY0_9ACTN|nr:hypothetical protein [Nonomuraea jiangxiensis]SDL37896.1 hypothetical protein SAMN05421869_12571 [Nonomuraea jiangxiensis]
MAGNGPHADLSGHPAAAVIQALATTLAEVIAAPLAEVIAAPLAEVIAEQRLSFAVSR